jgi:hypothetical protein
MVERTASDPNTVAAILRRLEQRRLVRREAHTRDRRARCVFLTAEGQRVQRRSRSVPRSLSMQVRAYGRQAWDQRQMIERAAARRPLIEPSIAAGTRWLTLDSPAAGGARRSQAERTPRWPRGITALMSARPAGGASTIAGACPRRAQRWRRTPNHPLQLTTPPSRRG